jgi:uncharacterized delta-60 repeat protein
VLGGTTTLNASGGVATFSNLSITAPGDYTLTATAGSDTPATSMTFTLSLPGANELVIAQQPVGTTAQVTLAPVIVNVRDSHGQPLSSDTSTVTLSVASGPAGAVLGGTTTVAAVGGVATFNNLFLSVPGTGYTLMATDGGDVPATTTAFNITAPAANIVVFTQQPLDTMTIDPLAPVIVSIEDSTGTVLTTATSSVTLAIASGPTGATLAGTTTVTAVNGVATFIGLSISTPGTYTLSATTSVASTGTSATFKITAPVETVGGLNPTFANKGLAVHSVGIVVVNGIARDGTQAVIVGGASTLPSQSFGLTRYNADGTLDTTFGTNGLVTTNFNNTTDVANAVVVLSNGDILVAGTAVSTNSSEFALAEYNPDGSLNTAFGSGTGKVLFNFALTNANVIDVLKALVVGPTGTIYVGGSESVAGGNRDFAIAALNGDGTFDTAFGPSGLKLQDLSGGDDVINSLALQPNGSLVAAGSTTAAGVTSVALARFLPSGTLDPRFGAKGIVTTSVRGIFDQASSVGIQPNGAIVIGGLSTTGTTGALSTDFLLARYTTTGKLDRTFAGGTVITSFGQPSAITQLLIQSNGNIVASGRTSSNLNTGVATQLDIALARYTTRGILDTTFNTTGKEIISLKGTTLSSSSTEAQPLTLITADDLGDLFDQFVQSNQGAITTAVGGELLDAGTDGANTVEAQIISGGVDLVTTVQTALPASVIAGAKGAVTIKIAEDATAIASGSITIDLQFATDSAGSNATSIKDLAQKLHLPQSKSHTYRIAFVYPTGLSAGSYYLVATIVEDGSLTDLNPNNNTAPSSTAVKIAPANIALTGATLSPTRTFTAGETVSVMFTLTDIGNETAKGTTTVEVILSPDQTAASGTAVYTSKLAMGIAPGKSRTSHISFKLPTTVQATMYYLIAVIDPLDNLGSIDHTHCVIVDPTQVAVG